MDYEYMLGFEREIFDKLVKVVEEGDKELSRMLHGKKEEKEGSKNKLIMFNQDVEEFVDMDGNVIGPFGAGELVNINSSVAEILVEGGKAGFVDEE
jgi:DNA replication initiation complex subunit (GINS family)